MPLVVCRRAHKETLLWLWLFVGGLMSYLCYLSLFTYSLTHIVLCFCFVFSSYCLTYVASFSELSIFDCPFGIL
jgi:hypothetical protein